MTDPKPRASRFADLGPRVASGLALAGLALFDLWLGGAWVAALAALATVLMLWELHRMASGDPGWRAPALVLAASAGVGAAFLTAPFGLGWGLACLAAGALGLLLAARPPLSLWMATGLVYVGFAMAYLSVIRDAPGFGLAAVLWLILVVVAADVGAYFVGRAVGGPKLWLRVSPGKTWSGALGGQAFAVLVGLGLAAPFGWRPLVAFLASFGVALASQAGDLLESAVKRHFGVKDASRLIPGHGGVMDRLDGILGGLWFMAFFHLLGGSLGG